MYKDISVQDGFFQDAPPPEGILFFKKNNSTFMRINRYWFTHMEPGNFVTVSLKAVESVPQVLTFFV